MVTKPIDTSRRRSGYALEALPGIIVHLLGSVAAWTFVQVNGLMVAGCGAERTCNATMTDLAVNGIQPALIAVWAVTALLSLARALAWRRSPWRVLGIGMGVSILITGLAYLMLRIGAGVQ
ncbi:hypothetical protein [Microbacterium rhizomatis]|uniref:DUF2231 domain-containing protein n=1 Tax=Microbacterium rhizomatis TaxID=1631477 RepID=A0A5J5J5B4_9MICO|nr:hypothetical protein [Microbacterium rhizomatis]KAA9111357.1 hypothetical protein F6B43_07175 [Microbacterium rhizomatis]